MLNTRNEENATIFYSNLVCFCAYIYLEYVRIHVIYRVHQPEYVVLILEVAPQEYVNIYSTRRCASAVLFLCEQLACMHVRIDEWRNNKIGCTGAAHRGRGVSGSIYVYAHICA